MALRRRLSSVVPLSRVSLYGIYTQETALSKERKSPTQTAAETVVSGRYDWHPVPRGLQGPMLYSPLADLVALLH